jgi:hypothetical protein
MSLECDSAMSINLERLVYLAKPDRNGTAGHVQPNFPSTPDVR